MDYVDRLPSWDKAPSRGRKPYACRIRHAGVSQGSRRPQLSAVYPAIAPRDPSPLSSCLPSNLAPSTRKVSCHCNSLVAIVALHPLAHHHSALSNGLYPDRSSCSISAAVRNCSIVPDLTSQRAVCLAHSGRPKIPSILSVSQRRMRSVLSTLGQWRRM
jgi:hypothetical protein